MKRRLLAVSLWAVGALSLLCVPALLLYNGWPVDLPAYFSSGLLLRPHLSTAEWAAIRDLLVVLIPIGVLSLWIASKCSRKYMKEVK